MIARNWKSDGGKNPYFETHNLRPGEHWQDGATENKFSEHDVVLGGDVIVYPDDRRRGLRYIPAGAAIARELVADGAVWAIWTDCFSERIPFSCHVTLQKKLKLLRVNFTQSAPSSKSESAGFSSPTDFYIQRHRADRPKIPSDTNIPLPRPIPARTFAGTWPYSRPTRFTLSSTARIMTSRIDVPATSQNKERLVTQGLMCLSSHTTT